ncbi:MAG: hypothetical protein JWQ38_2788, partial [Flavipsychrobacter sp.]|nr:hypothetical protein [Flavipsychrobacter sp.]
ERKKLPVFAGIALKDILLLAPQHIFMYKRAYYTGIIAYIVMLFLAVVFYKERTIFTDTAFYLFYIIKNNDFTIQIFRFGNVLCQFPALLARKGNAPINTILQVYSFTYAAYYFAAYLICGLGLKRYDFALIILLLNVLFVSDTFYWMPSEMPLGIAMLMLVLAYLGNKKDVTVKPAAWALLLAAMVTIVFFHPLIVFILAFSIIFFMLGGHVVISRRTLLNIGAIYIIVLLTKMLIFRSPYEQHSMSGLKNFVTQFPDYITLFSNKRFLVSCLTKYYWIPVLFAGIIVFYARAKEVKKLWFFIASVIGYLALVNISYPTAATPQFYMESLYTPLAIFIALPLVFDVLPAWGNGRFILPVMALIIATGCIRMYTTHTPYTARLNYERKILDQYGEQKVILNSKHFDEQMLQMLWGTPYEFLLLAECERNTPASILIDNNPAKYGWAVTKNNSLIVNWNVFLYSELPKKYFNFTDTTSRYSVEKN